MAETVDAGKKVKIKFLRDEIYETEGRGLGKKFAAGRVYSMTEDQAGRWLRRDAAELVEEAAEADGDEPSKPRRGRPPKAKGGDESGEDEDGTEEEDSDPAAKPPPPPPKPPEPAPKPSAPAPTPPPVEPARSPYKAR